MMIVNDQSNLITHLLDCLLRGCPGYGFDLSVLEVLVSLTCIPSNFDPLRANPRSFLTVLLLNDAGHLLPQGLQIFQAIDTFPTQLAALSSESSTPRVTIRDVFPNYFTSSYLGSGGCQLFLSPATETTVSAIIVASVTFISMSLAAMAPDTSSTLPEASLTIFTFYLVLSLILTSSVLVIYDSMKLPTDRMPSVSITPPVTIPFCNDDPIETAPSESVYQADLGWLGVPATRAGPPPFWNWSPSLSLITSKAF